MKTKAREWFPAPVSTSHCAYRISYGALALGKFQGISQAVEALPGNAGPVIFVAGKF